MTRKQKNPQPTYTIGSWFRVPKEVLQSDNYRACSASARSLLFDLLLQFTGRNNGDLSAAEGIMKPLGWKSKRRLMSARAELLHYRLIEITRQGGKTKAPTLYALTFINRHHCGGKLDLPATEYPTDAWREPVGPWVNPYSRNRIATLKKIDSTGSAWGPYRFSVGTTKNEIWHEIPSTGSAWGPIPLIFRPRQVRRGDPYIFYQGDKAL